MREGKQRKVGSPARLPHLPGPGIAKRFSSSGPLGGVLRRVKRPGMPLSWAGTMGLWPRTGRLSSEDLGLAGGLLPLLIGSLPGLPAVLPVLLGTSLTPGLVRLGHAVAVTAEV